MKHITHSSLKSKVVGEKCEMPEKKLRNDRHGAEGLREEPSRGKLNIDAE